MTLSLAFLLVTSRPKSDLTVPLAMLAGLIVFVVYLTWLSRKGKRKMLEAEAAREAELYNIRRTRRLAQLERTGQLNDVENDADSVRDGGAVETAGVR